MPIHYVMPKILKYNGRDDLTKHLNSYKAHMSMRGTSPTVTCRAFHLTLCGASKIWYSQLPLRSIKSWPKFKTTFVKRFAVNKDENSSMPRAAAWGDSKEFFISIFWWDDISCTSDRPWGLVALRRGLNMNTLFWRDVQNQHSIMYDALMEMMRCKIINEELIDQRNRASRGLQPPQRQHGKGPTSHLMDHQWNHVGYKITPTQDRPL